jgi:hypothetical protein
MQPNVGKIDRATRIVAGLALLSLLFVLPGNARCWGLLGVLLVTVFIRWCPGLRAARRHHGQRTGNKMNMRLWGLIAIGVCTGFAYAQAPVEEGRRTPDAVLDAQQKAGMAYRDWQDAATARAQAETELKQATAAYQSAQQQLSDTKRRAEIAKKTLEAAQAQEITTHKTYDKATEAVDRVWGKKMPSKQ